MTKPFMKMGDNHFCFNISPFALDKSLIKDATEKRKK